MFMCAQNAFAWTSLGSTATYGYVCDGNFSVCKDTSGYDNMDSTHEYVNGVYALQMQSDGNLVLRHSGSAIWSTGTAGHTGATLNFQTDGNMVLRSSTGSTLWSAGTGGHIPASWCYVMSVYSDGNLVLKVGNASGNSYSCTQATAMWSSGTSGL
jgi:hypothetical protein